MKRNINRAGGVVTLAAVLALAATPVLAAHPTRAKSTNTVPGGLVVPNTATVTPATVTAATTTAVIRTASVTLGGTLSAITVTSTDTTQFGKTVTRTLTSSGNPPTGSVPLVTPGGTVTAALGGSNAYTTSGNDVGQMGDVTKGDLTITASTDTKLTKTGGGAFAEFDTAVGLTYASFGVWSLNPCANTATCLPAYVGSYGGAQNGQMQTATMPKAGSATYTGGAAGYVVQSAVAGTAPKYNAGQFWGTSSLTANFATNALTGSITNITAYSVNNSGSGQTALGTVNAIALTGTISGSAFTGTTSASTTKGTAFNPTGATGSLTGGFYGPAANEVAGVFSLNGGTYKTTLVGSFGARQPSTNYSASVTLGGTKGAFTATPNTALFGNVQSVNPAILTNSVPDGFLANGTIQTPGGLVNTQAGGSAAFSTTATVVGQAGTVNAGDFTITGSTDTKIPVGDYGSYNSFAAAVGLSYASFGSWSLNPCSATGSGCSPTYIGTSAGAQAGVQKTAAMPTTGSATYTGGAEGYVLQPVAKNANNAAQFWGTSSLTANFATNAITGSVSAIKAYNPSTQALLGTVNTVNLTATISGANFTGTTSASTTKGTAFNTTGATGNLTGSFYGPAANEVAGVFNLNGGTNSTTLVGSFGAKAATAPSDRRLKTDILPAGTLPNGLHLYSWRYLGGTHRFTGVMAQDLASTPRFARAVDHDADGLMRVNYEALGYLPADMATMRAEGEAAVTLYRATLH